jgi:hypothetical protein
LVGSSARKGRAFTFFNLNFSADENNVRILRFLFCRISCIQLHLTSFRTIIIKTLLMKSKSIYILIAAFLVASCASQTVTCPTYENDYVYVPRKASKPAKKSKSKPRVRAEQ